MVVRLRQVTGADVERFFEHQRDPVAAAMAAFPPRDEAAHRAHWERLLATPEVVTRTVLVDGAVAGNVGSWPTEDGRLVGYWIDRSHWGRGVATAALRAFVRELPRPLRAFVATSNAGSIRVLEKCGFVRVAEPVTGDDGVEEVVLELA